MTFHQMLKLLRKYYRPLIDDDEGMLHDVCHCVTLGIPVDVHVLPGIEEVASNVCTPTSEYAAIPGPSRSSIEIPQSRWVFQTIDRQCCSLTDRACDANEISTIACEYHVLEEVDLQHFVRPKLDGKKISFTPNNLAEQLCDLTWKCFEHPDGPQKLVVRQIDTKVARLRAQKSIEYVYAWMERLRHTDIEEASEI